ncbi:MAG: phosphoribulokinase [Thermoleophilaceae bacterium]|nr:phosphoribulokinase [Thermoleophilaceae bacterium]
MARAIVVGVVGDSGAGKTTVTRGLARVLGEGRVAYLSADDYHRYDRRQRAELDLTPLHPRANYLDVLTQHLAHLRDGEPVLKPVYSHRDGGFHPPEYLRPAPFLVVEGLLNLHTEALRNVHDVRVMLAPPEALRRAWKVKRDCTRRGYTTSQVLAELDRRQGDAETFVQPQRAHADLVVSFVPNSLEDPTRLDADLILRDTLPHPDLSPLLAGQGPGPALIKREREWLLRIPGDLDPEHAMALEEAVWERMSFAKHLRTSRLGEFTVGTDLLRSDSLALVQLLILYHAVTARAAFAAGVPARTGTAPRTGADSAMHLD